MRAWRFVPYLEVSQIIQERYPYNEEQHLVTVPVWLPVVKRFDCVYTRYIYFLCKLTPLIYVHIYSSENPGRVSYCPRSNRSLFHDVTEVQ